MNTKPQLVQEIDPNCQNDPNTENDVITGHTDCVCFENTLIILQHFVAFKTKIDCF